MILQGFLDVCPPACVSTVYTGGSRHKTGGWGLGVGGGLTQLLVRLVMLVTSHSDAYSHTIYYRTSTVST